MKRFIENGQINDQYRIEFISEHLTWLHKGISEGAIVLATICGRLLITGRGVMRIKIATDLSSSI
jgi:hypothetical protein